VPCYTVDTMSQLVFTTTLYTIGDRTILYVPEEESKKLPSRGQIMAKGTINGHDFRDAFEPDGAWSHWLDVTPELQERLGVAAGDSVTVVMESTKEWPEPRVPADWQSAIDADPQVHALWDRVTPMARWEWLRWINATSVAETRAKRIEVSCSKLLNGLRRPCCFNRNMCCVPDVSKNGVLLQRGSA